MMVQRWPPQSLMEKRQSPSIYPKLTFLGFLVFSILLPARSHFHIKFPQKRHNQKGTKGGEKGIGSLYSSGTTSEASEEEHRDSSGGEDDAGKVVLDSELVVFLSLFKVTSKFY